MDGRPSTPPPFQGRGHPFLAPPPTPGTPGTPGLPINGNWITGSQHARVPPSPCGVPGAGFGNSMSLKAHTVKSSPLKSKMQERSVTSPRPGSGVSKLKNKGRSDAAKHLNAAACGKTSMNGTALEKPFRFMDLPGEVRNMIYHHTDTAPNQALLVHRPRLASLRLRTRLDRSRPLASDIVDSQHDKELNTNKTKKKTKDQLIPRNTNRPFYALTQVSRQIRLEYRPIYLQKQEIGMDLTDIAAYLKTFYSDAPDVGAALEKTTERKVDMPFTGNLTIAVGDTAKGAELGKEGIDIWPLLDIWANSYKIEAGFGRYMKAGYSPERDGEAKDLYRLFGRRVLPNRSCSNMNALWRTILRTRSLTAVRIYRKAIFNGPRPCIHILFRKESAEPWMTGLDSRIPSTWLKERGFGDMEHFQVKVGVLAEK